MTTSNVKEIDFRDSGDLEDFLRSSEFSAVELQEKFLGEIKSGTRLIACFSSKEPPQSLQITKGEDSSEKLVALPFF